MAGLATIGQGDFSAGIYRGREAPPTAVYDAVNALIDDEGQIYKRGGSTYVTTSDAGSDLLTLSSAYYPAPSAMRTLAFGPAAAYVVNGTSFTTLYSVVGPPPRVTAAGRRAVWPWIAGTGIPGTIFYAGSVETAFYDTGTVTATNGSLDIVGAGTTWVGNIDPGMLLTIDGSTRRFVVKTVTDNTHITLDSPYDGATGAGKFYEADVVVIGPDYGDIFRPVLSTDALPYAAFVGRRVIVAYGTRVAFTPVDDPDTQNATDYHELPSDAFIIGVDGVDDTAIVFTTVGIWTISNLFFDPVDDAGNVQHIVGRANKEIVLWGDRGIAAWAGGFIVPAVDGIYALDLSGQAEQITGGMRPLYLSYVKAGYQPGLGAVHHGHYVLPVLEGSTLRDVIICRLDRERAWTRWNGHAAALGFATQVGASTRSPKLYGVQDRRVIDLTDCFTPSSANTLDADASTPTLTVITSDYPTSQRGDVVTRLRARYEYIYSDMDDFEDTPDGALGPPWLGWIGPMPTITSGVASVALGAFGDATRPETQEADCFCQATFDRPVSVNNGEMVGVGVRLTAHSGSADGYMFGMIGASPGMRGRLYKGAARTTLATGSSFGFTGVEGVRISAVGTTIKGYFLMDGLWTEVLSATDATYAAAGFPGFYVDLTASGLPLGVESVSWGSGAGSEQNIVTPAFSSDADDDVFTDLVNKGEQGGGDGWGLSDGSKYQWALVNKRRERIRFRLTQSGQAASFVLRSLEGFVRGTGRQ